VLEEFRSHQTPTRVLVAEDVHVRYQLDGGARSLRSVFTRRRALSDRIVEAVRGVDLTLRHGDALAVIGRNGSGKSTLLRALAGLVAPSQGRVLAAATPVLLGVQSVLQPELSCVDNIMMGSTALGMSRAQARLHAPAVLHFAGLEGKDQMPYRTLSSGMRARLEFSIATEVRPEILIVDETLAVGDAEFRLKSERRIAELVGEARSVILVSHSMGFVRSVATRVVWMDSGRVVMSGTPGEVIAAYDEAVQA
jgi:teichoic acid transport system ATP-binding protein